METIIRAIKSKKLLIVSALLAFYLLLVLLSCGSKKVITSTIQKETEQKSEQNKDVQQAEQKRTETQTHVKQKNQQSTMQENKTGVSFISNQPVKISKDGIEFTPNGQVNINLSSYYEGKLSAIRDSSSHVVDSLQKTLQDRTREVNSLKTQLKTKDKDTDKKGNVVPWAWVVFGGIGLAIVSYFLYKYFTNPKRKL